MLTAAQWTAFKTWAIQFYGELLSMAVAAGGETNPQTIQLIMGKITPDILELIEFYDAVGVEFEPQVQVDVSGKPAEGQVQSAAD